MARAKATFPLTSRHENSMSTLSFFICNTAGLGSAPYTRFTSLNVTFRPKLRIPVTAAWQAAADWGTPYATTAMDLAPSCSAEYASPGPPVAKSRTDPYVPNNVGLLAQSVETTYPNVGV